MYLLKKKFSKKYCQTKKKNKLYLHSQSLHLSLQIFIKIISVLNLVIKFEHQIRILTLLEHNNSTQCSKFDLEIKN